MELNQCINYLLTTAQHAVFQEMSAQLSKFDVTPVQYGVMYCLWVKKKNSPKEIAEELRLENSTISGTGSTEGILKAPGGNLIAKNFISKEYAAERCLSGCYFFVLLRVWGIR